MLEQEPSGLTVEVNLLHNMSQSSIKKNSNAVIFLTVYPGEKPMTNWCSSILLGIKA